MKRTLISLILIALFTSAFAQETENKRKLGLFASMDIASQSVWLGWDLSNNKPAYIPYVAIDLWQTGFETAFWASMPLDRELNTLDDFELFLKYNKNIFADRKGGFNFHGFIDYIWLPNQTNFPHRPILNDDLTYIPQEGLKQLWKMDIGISFPNLLPVGDYYIVPGYDIYYISPAGGAYFTPGSVHELSFKYNRPLGKIASLSLSSNTYYHHRIFDAQGLAATVGTAVVSFKLTESLNFNTQVNYQQSFDDMVNADNEFWVAAGISVSL